MFKKQIEAGASLLDEKVPGWESKIDLEELDLSDTYFCVIGQLFPHTRYVKVICEVFWSDLDQDTSQLSINHGFALDVFSEYPALTKEWKQFIQERRDEPVFSLRRMLGGIRQWFYLAIVCECDMPVGLLYFIRYHKRPCARDRNT